MSENDSKPRFRSPPYPAIDLSKAIERAKQLYSKAMHHPAGTAVLAEAWGYGEKSSGLWATAAALIHFGLIRDEGTGPKRKFTLSDTAVRIIRDADPDSEKRRDAIRRAALSPTIHSELREKFGIDPGLSDIVLKNYLTLDRADEGKAAFSDGAADDVIRIYKDSMAFAGIAISANLPPLEEGMGDEDDDDDFDIAAIRAKRETMKLASSPVAPKQPTAPQHGERVLQDGILSRETTYRIIVKGKIGPREIDRLIKKLELDKEILADAEGEDGEEENIFS
ncbi:hypothetical protein FHX14_001073 [Rhizobium sp. BK619]|uniref:hypothetical protein n=1 Tax=Rhizobium sp. BK619 TaxID=2586989 RepID=UPI00160B7E5A|nr:hypothetical protein [Rhizobium sp. BK619]MBB3644910.1 hypothetical protein [Rhizobium sp. BK619]